MAIPHVEPGEVVNVAPLGPELHDERSHTLIKNDQFEMIRLVLSTGKVLAEHRAPGALIVQCIEGRIQFSAHGKTHTLHAGQLLHLAAKEPHTVTCLQDGSLLLTILFDRDAAETHAKPPAPKSQQGRNVG